MNMKYIIKEIEDVRYDSSKLSNVLNLFEPNKFKKYVDSPLVE